MTALSVFGIMLVHDPEKLPEKQQTMKSYPRLSEMGVIHPEQIAGYSLSSLDYVDFLRVDYKRPKNSVLPVCRTYRFPRRQDTQDGKSVLATDPALKEAVAELRDIVETSTDKHDIATAMREEIQSLQQEINLRTEQLKSLIDSIETG